MITIIAFLLGIIIIPIVSILGVIFYCYTQALKEAYEEGWDMPT